MCPFRDQPCQHLDWADCQFQFAGDEDEYTRLWHAGEEDKMGKNCSLLPEGITRTEMLTALGAFGEKEKVRVLESIKKGCYGEKKRRIFGGK
jgi:hypothetical protein